MPDDTKPKLILDDDWKSQAQAERAAAAKPAPALEVDADWKNQAQAEKDRLAQSAKPSDSRSARDPGSPGGGVVGGGPEAMPAADFPALVGTLVTQAVMYLGGFPDPKTGRAIVHLDYAKFHIDMLAVLQDKTKGNLTPEEADDVNQAVHELRLRFVEISKLVTEATLKQAGGGKAGGVIGL